MNAVDREEKAARREVVALRISRKELKNATACRYFLHALDQDADGQPTCYFSNGYDADSWGFWVSKDGQVTIDSESSNGELPNQKIVDACKRAAVAYLSK